MKRKILLISGCIYLTLIGAPREGVPVPLYVPIVSDVTIYGDLIVLGGISVSQGITTTQDGRTVSYAQMDMGGNVITNGIDKNGVITVWPSNAGQVGQVLQSDGNGNLVWGSGGSGTGNVSTAVNFTAQNHIATTDTAQGPTNIHQSGVVIDNSNNMTGVNSLTASSLHTASLNVDSVNVNTSGVLLLPVGSLSNPSLQWNNSPLSVPKGFYADLPDSLTFVAGGAAVLKLTSAGISLVGSGHVINGPGASFDAISATQNMNINGSLSFNQTGWQMVDLVNGSSYTVSPNTAYFVIMSVDQNAALADIYLPTIFTGGAPAGMLLTFLRGPNCTQTYTLRFHNTGSSALFPESAQITFNLSSSPGFMVQIINYSDLPASNGQWFFVNKL